MKHTEIKPRTIKVKTNPKSFLILAESKIGKESVQTINARNLYRWLQIKTDYSDWIRKRVEEGRFIENRDFIKIPQKKVVDKINNLHSKIIDHHISLDMAKHLAMIERNDKGFEAREYFIQCEKELKGQQLQPYMPRGYPQMLEAARNDWKQVRNELISLIGTHLQIYDRKRKSQFTNQIYLDLIETTARRLREHFLLTRSNQLTRDYLHQLVQECIVEIEIRLSDSIISGSITSWEVFKNELEQISDHVRYMKELQNGRTPLPQYAYPIIQNLQVT